MNWLQSALDRLAEQPAIGYANDSAPATEPTALAALALAVHGRGDAALAAGKALLAMQGENGAVGVRRGEPSPGWPTSLAVVAWSKTDVARFDAPIGQAVKWLLANRGQAIERSPDHGHNSELVGWAYAEQTHSWVEPTALAILALEAAGNGEHPAVREGVALLVNRELPSGGLNYGNTLVLGQALRPHVQPTGMALLALASHRSPHAPREEFVSRSETSTMRGRISKSIVWLRRTIGPKTTPLSLGWALLGLRAHGALPPQSDEWLATAAARVNERDRSLHKLALLALAAKGWPT